MTSPRYALLFADIAKRASTGMGAANVSPTRYRAEEIALVEEAIDRKKRSLRRAKLAARASTLVAVVGIGLGAWWMVGRRSSENPARAAARAAHVNITVDGTAAHGSTADVASQDGIDPSSAARGTAPLIVASASGKSAITTNGGAVAQLGAGSHLGVGSRVIVDPAAGTTFSLSTGTRLDVASASQITVVEEGRTQILALDAGAMHAEVAKLRPAERFIVRTLDAEIEVRGTSFLVNVVAPNPDCGDGTITRVRVDEGVVVVRHGAREDTLRRGDQWPQGCPVEPHAGKAAARPVAIHPRATASGGTPSSEALPNVAVSRASEETLSDRVPASHLNDENNFFAAAMMAKRSGQPALALTRLDAFLERYPAGPLAETATVERVRLLMQSHPARGILAAKQYLVRYPAGFARQEAEAIIAGTRP